MDSHAVEVDFSPRKVTAERQFVENFEGWTSMSSEELSDFLIKLAQDDPKMLLEILAKGPPDEMLDNPTRFSDFHKIALKSLIDSRPFEESRSLIGDYIDMCENTSYGYSCLMALADTLGGSEDFNKGSTDILSLLFSRERDGSFTQLYFGEFGKTHSAEEVLSHIKTLSLSKLHRDGGLLQAALSISRNSPIEALKLVSEVPSSGVGGAYGRILAEILRSNPNEFITTVESLSNTAFSSIGLDPEFMKSLALKENFQSAKLLLGKIPLNEYNREGLYILLSQAGKESVSNAFGLIEDFPDSPFKTSLIKQAIQAQEVKNAAAAGEIVSATPAKHRIATATQLLNDLGAGKEDNRLLETKNFMDSLDRETAERVSGEFIRVASGIDPNIAINLFDEYMIAKKIGGDQMSMAGAFLTESLANLNTDVAIKWLETAPPFAKIGGYESLIRSWGNSEPVEAAQWLQEQEPGPARNAGIRELIDIYKVSDPTVAKEWSDLLTE